MVLLHQNRPHLSCSSVDKLNKLNVRIASWTCKQGTIIRLFRFYLHLFKIYEVYPLLYGQATYICWSPEKTQLSLWGPTPLSRQLISKNACISLTVLFQIYQSSHMRGCILVVFVWLFSTVYFVKCVFKLDGWKDSQQALVQAADVDNCLRNGQLRTTALLRQRTATCWAACLGCARFSENRKNCP